MFLLKFIKLSLVKIAKNTKNLFIYNEICNKIPLILQILKVMAWLYEKQIAYAYKLM